MDLETPCLFGEERLEEVGDFEDGAVADGAGVPVHPFPCAV